ncbi:PrsW family glutamic-type intramembrane protease [Promicromonospora sp. NPDC090134]|uniref:PrsW family glutamic-type intramembrane protease n=1 Tax=Promicromonospora sp. NPDC090134 TaxID=3364408 RepID=UPI0037F9FB43
MTLVVVGAILFLVGTAGAFVAARPRDGVPAAGWYPDPSTHAAQQRFWDSRAWTGEVADGGPAAARGRHFRGRFWGTWVWYLVAAVVVLAAGSVVYQSSGNIHVMGVASFLGMAGVCWAFYRFVNRQLALDDVVGPVTVLAVAVGTSGAVLLVAANINSWIINGAGIVTATAWVGVVEEGTKLLVPLLLFVAGRYRDPRAGIAVGLASGFGFAITETTQYAYATETASGPNFCGTGTLDATPAAVVQEQIFRVFTVSPLHWLWTGIAAAIAWRLWHLYGGRGTWGALGGIALVMVVHSLNDSSATAFCDDPAASTGAVVLRWVLVVVMYVVFRAWARKSVPPQLVGVVSRGWVPKHLARRAARARSGTTSQEPTARS